MLAFHVWAEGATPGNADANKEHGQVAGKDQANHDIPGVHMLMISGTCSGIAGIGRFGQGLNAHRVG